MSTSMESRIYYDDYRNREVSVAVQELDVPNFEARLATALLEKWGLVAGAPDGEDSAGRQALRLATPEELVDRAVSTAEMAIEAFRQKGWMHRLPTFAEKDAFRDALPGDKT